MKAGPPLRQRLRLLFLVPIAVGSIIIASVALAPVFLKYRYWVDSSANEIINYQSAFLTQLASQVAQLNSAFLQTPLNLALVISRLMQKYYDGDLLLKPHFMSSLTLEESSYCNAVELYWENKTELDYQRSMWYLSPNITKVRQLDSVNAQILRECAAFDSFLRPTVAATDGKRTLEVFLGFEETGFFYSSPAAGYSFLANYSESRDCPYSKQRNQPYYDPRCRPWYTRAKSTDFRYYPLLSDPYIVFFDNHIGQNVCSGVWTSGELVLVLSLDFSVGLLEADIDQLNQVKGGYSFALNVDGTVFTHPNFNRYASTIPTIFDLEFGGNSSAEALAFKDKIVPLFESGKSALRKYTKNGNTMLIAIQPVYTNMGTSGLYLRQMSTAVVMPQDILWRVVESLRSRSASILLVEILVICSFVIAELVIGWLLTRYVANSVVRPLDQMAAILQRMMDGDLKIDIREPPKHCSKDIRELYKVFRKLKVVLRFGEKEYFMQNDAETLINLSQALNLFEEFGNVQGIRMCCNSIGMIHLRYCRYAEAIDYYSQARSSAISATLRKNISERERYENRVALLTSTNNLAFAMMEESRQTNRSNAKEAVVLLLDALGRCTSSGYSQAYVDSLILLAEGYSEDDQLPLAYQSLATVDAVISDPRATLSVPISILRERTTFVRGLLAEKEGHLAAAGEIFTECLVMNEHYDMSIRAKCLKHLQALFEAQGIDAWDVSRLLDECKFANIDLVILIDYSSSMQQTLLIDSVISCVLQLFDSTLHAEDRVSLILVDKTHRVLFRLSPKSRNTEFLRSRIQKSTTPADIPDFALFDTLTAVIPEISVADISPSRDCELLSLPSEFPELPSTSRGKWILAVTASCDTCSSASFSNVQRAFAAHPSVNFYCVTLGLCAEERDRMAALCSLTRRGRTVECSKESEVKGAFQNIAEVVFPLRGGVV